MWYAKVVYETFDFFGGFDSSWLLLGIPTVGFKIPSTILLLRPGSDGRLRAAPPRVCPRRHAMSCQPARWVRCSRIYLIDAAAQKSCRWPATAYDHGLPGLALKYGEAPGTRCPPSEKAAASSCGGQMTSD